MKPSRWPHWLDDVWAKSPREGEAAGESLAQHTWSVLARFADLAHMRSSLADLFDAPNLWHCLFWACFLHDFGKAASGFQAVLRGGERWPHRHEVLSLAFLDWIAPALSETERRWILAAIVSHHRDADEIDRLYSSLADPDPLVGLLAQLDEQSVRGLWQWLDACAADWIAALGLSPLGVRTLPIVDESRAVQFVCAEGARRTRAWLQIYRRFVDKLRSPMDQRVVATLVMLRGLTTTADHAASAHLARVPEGITSSWGSLARTALGSCDPAATTYLHQRESAACSGDCAMLAAPTGSGKTEAALFWAVGDGTRPVPRIFYALPYQASMNAMYDRLGLPGYFGQEQVGLQHGRALQALYQRLMNSEVGPKTAVQMAKQQQNLTKLHASPVKVFSPYQMLKAAYGIKGFEGMLTDYAQAAFIFDEIHAYEPARLAVILGMVKHLREHFGARFFIMSATFPRIIQALLADALAIREPIMAEQALFEQFCRHRLVLLDGELLTDGISRIVKEVQQGKSVLVCCNTVRRAQEVRAALLVALPANQVEVIHSRYTLRDRLARETAIRARCKLGTAHNALALVATQVVEVSLNIDLDTIYTDPAPLDALIQRFGRVNRARKKGIVPVHVFRQPDDGQYVYEAPMVQKTLAVLAAHTGSDIDEAGIGEWLNEVYAEPAIYEPWMKTYRQQADTAALLLRDLRPFNSNPRREEEFEKLFDGVEVLPRCFEAEYLKHITNDEFLEASSLFVSISQRKYYQLLNQGKIRQLENDKHKRWLATLPYDRALGLLFDELPGTTQDFD
jgi:CRISPR-associated endonuclease/helicase Cas3